MLGFNIKHVFVKVCNELMCLKVYGKWSVHIYKYIYIYVYIYTLLTTSLQRDVLMPIARTYGVKAGLEGIL